MSLFESIADVLSAHPESSLTIYKCWMLPLGKLPDAGQWDESELLVQGLKKKRELNWSVSDSSCMKSQTKSCEATQVKPQTKTVAENELFEFKKCLAIQSLRKKHVYFLCFK